MRSDPDAHWTRYNGKPRELVRTVEGATAGSVELAGDGIVSRGVLLDIARLRGVPWLEPSDPVFPEDLDAAEAAQGPRVEAGDILHAQQIGGVRLLLAEDCHQHVRDGDLFLAARLHVKDGALQDALKTKGRLNFPIVVVGQARRSLLDEGSQVALEFRHVRTAGAQDLAHLGGVQDRQQEMLHRHELMTGLARVLKRFIQTVFKLVAQHGQVSSIVHNSGC